LEDIAANFGFNTTYFSEMFKNETNKNFSVYLVEVRMEAAKKLLRDTRDTIYDIAYKVGYKDAKFFSQQFAKTVGIKPTEYRKLYY
jgi:two-component system response regulator YesN